MFLCPPKKNVQTPCSTGPSQLPPTSVSPTDVREFCWKFGSTLKLLVQLRSFGGTLTRWKSTAQWRSTSLRKASFSQIHPLESTIKQLIFSTWASSHGVWSHHGLVGILSARPERLQKSLINCIKKLSQSPSNKYCLTIVIKLGVFPPPTSSLFLFFEMQICQHPSQFDHQRKVLHEPTLAWYSPQFSAGSHQVFFG